MIVVNYKVYWNDYTKRCETNSSADLRYLGDWTLSQVQQSNVKSIHDIVLFC